MRVPISQFYKGSEVDENSVVDISSVKLVDESSVLVKNTGLKMKELDKKAVVYQSVFSLSNYSKVPIIRTGTYASSAVHTMYCQNCPMFGTYNRSFRVWGINFYTPVVSLWSG